MVRMLAEAKAKQVEVCKMEKGKVKQAVPEAEAKAKQVAEAEAKANQAPEEGEGGGRISELETKFEAICLLKTDFSPLLLCASKIC